MMSMQENIAGVDTQTLVVGLGASGMSCARFLHQRGEPFAIMDSRDAPPALQQLHEEMPAVPTYFGGFDEHILKTAKRILISPGLSLKEPLITKAINAGVEVYGDIELFARYADAPVVAITGSNGKTTVTTLLGEMANTAGLNVKVGGNIGTPALDLLRQSLAMEEERDTPSKGTDFYVLELSSFQLETTQSLNACAAVVLNVSPDHMDRYADVAEYAHSKQRIYRGDGTLVINRDDKAVVAMRAEFLQANSNRKVIYFSLQQPADDEFGIQTFDGRQWLAHGEKRLLDVSELRIPGSHNQANALAALALGFAMNIPMEVMCNVLRQFNGLPHRTQWVAQIDGVNWYNDSKGTNVGATVAAIAGMSGEKILLAGGDGKDADFTPLKSAVVNHGVKAVVLIGKDGPSIEKVLAGCVPIHFAINMGEAVKQAHALARSLAQPGASVLLSPACASFDMFANYVERGDVFMQSVKELQS